MIPKKKKKFGLAIMMGPSNHASMPLGGAEEQQSEEDEMEALAGPLMEAAKEGDKKKFAYFLREAIACCMGEMEGYGDRD